MIGALMLPMTRATAQVLEVLESNAIWTSRTSTTGLLPTDILDPALDTRMGRSNRSVNRSRNISRTHFDPSASRMDSPSDLIPGPHRLVNPRSASQYPIAFLDHLDPDLDLA